MKLDLSNYSIKELEEEIEKRKTSPSFPAPKLRQDMDWEILTNFIEGEIEKLYHEGYVIKDFEHWIFEYALEAIYGEQIWDFWNNTARR